MEARLMNMYYNSIPSQEMSDASEVMKKFCDQLSDEAKIVECGIADGRNIIFLASYMRFIGKRCRIWGIDTFEYGGNEQKNTVHKNIINSGETSITILEMSSLDASCKFDDDYFSLVFIDSSHIYWPTVAEAILWYRKLASDTGILAFHDYNRVPDVKLAVDTLIPDNRRNIEETTFNHGLAWVRHSKDQKIG